MEQQIYLFLKQYPKLFINAFTFFYDQFWSFHYVEMSNLVFLSSKVVKRVWNGMKDHKW